MSRSRLRGVVRAWTNRGYGWVGRSDGEPDVFVHYTDVLDGESLPPGELVTFRLDVDRDGRLKAIDVRIEGEAGARQEDV